MPHRIFISYAHSDARDFANALKSALNHSNKYEIFIDNDIVPGEPWEQSIAYAIANADIMLAVLTPGFNSSVQTAGEIKAAHGKGIRIIPIMHLHCEVQPNLAEVQYIDFTDKDKFHLAMHRLDGALKHHLSEDTIPSSSKNWHILPVKNFAVHIDRAKTVHCVSPTTTVAEAMDILKSHSWEFRHLLVTPSGKAGDKLLGLVSYRQLLKASHNPQIDIQMHRVEDDVMDKFDPIRRKIPTFVHLRDDANLQYALEAFTTLVAKAHAIEYFYFMSAIPIVDHDHNALGIVSFKDILKGMRNGQIPIPVGIVRDHMRRNEQVRVCSEKSKVRASRIYLAQVGQRDVPVVNRATHRPQFLGMVADDLMVANQFRDANVIDIMDRVDELIVQTPETGLRETIFEYLKDKYSERWFAFAVVNNKKEQIFEGLIGYRDIFKAMLKTLNSEHS
jgi:CBS domain-containing protein